MHSSSPSHSSRCNSRSYTTLRIDARIVLSRTKLEVSTLIFMGRRSSSIRCSSLDAGLLEELSLADNADTLSRTPNTPDPAALDNFDLVVLWKAIADAKSASAQRVTNRTKIRNIFIERFIAGEVVRAAQGGLRCRCGLRCGLWCGLWSVDGKLSECLQSYMHVGAMPSTS